MDEKEVKNQLSAVLSSFFPGPGNRQGRYWRDQGSLAELIHLALIAPTSLSQSQFADVVDGWKAERPWLKRPDVDELTRLTVAWEHWREAFSFQKSLGG